MGASPSAADQGCLSSGCESRPGNWPVGRGAYSTAEEVTNRQQARAYKVPGRCETVPNGQGGKQAGGPQHQGIPDVPKSPDHEKPFVGEIADESRARGDGRRPLSPGEELVKCTRGSRRHCGRSTPAQEGRAKSGRSR